jgi:hypothetical protein
VNDEACVFEHLQVSGDRGLGHLFQHTWIEGGAGRLNNN